MGLTPASTGPVFTLRSGRVCAPPRQAGGSGDSLSLCPVEPGRRGAVQPATRIPRTNEAPASSSPTLAPRCGGLSRTTGDPRIAPPSQLPSSPPSGGYCIVHTAPRPRKFLPRARAITWVRQEAREPSTLGCSPSSRAVLRPSGGAWFHDARANSTQTLCRPLASSPNCGVFPSRPHGCRELVATSQSD